MSEYKALYVYSLSEAIRNNEKDLWRESYKENCDCARAIEKAISENYRDNVLNDCVQPIIEKYGFNRVTIQLEQYANAQHKRESAKSRLDQIFTILDGMQNHPMEYDDRIVRQILECVVVESKETIKVVFVGGSEVREQLTP